MTGLRLSAATICMWKPWNYMKILGLPLSNMKLYYCQMAQVAFVQNWSRKSHDRPLWACPGGHIPSEDTHSLKGNVWSHASLYHIYAIALPKAVKILTTNSSFIVSWGNIRIMNALAPFPQKCHDLFEVTQLVTGRTELFGWITVPQFLLQNGQTGLDHLHSPLWLEKNPWLWATDSTSQETCWIQRSCANWGRGKMGRKEEKRSRSCNVKVTRS